MSNEKRIVVILGGMVGKAVNTHTKVQVENYLKAQDEGHLINMIKSLKVDAEAFTRILLSRGAAFEAKQTKTRKPPKPVE